MQTKKNKKLKPAGRKKFNLFQFFTVLLAVAVGIEIVLGSVGITALNSMLDKEQKLNVDDFFSQESTLVFDKDGNQIADVGLMLRENITYDQVPESLIDAFLSVEDSRYFTHNGFDIPRFTASVINTVLHGNTQGGSTFTMQLVKLTYFQNDEEGTSKTKDVQYKIQQIDLATQLEKKATKKEIFEMYLNKMNFGGIGNIRGVEKACEQYFGKSVTNINLSEAAMLAGVVNSPYYYNPYLYLDHATERRNEVLYQMLNHGYIDEKQYDLAKSVRVEDLLHDPKESQDTSYQYQAYIDYAIQEAQDITGQDPMVVSMEIHTAMDPHVQQTMEDIEAGNNPKIDFVNDNQEIGIITENNQTGEIIAIGGGRNFARVEGANLLNHATQQYKQPGSTVKPFLDYAPTFDYLGWATDHVLIDHPLTYGNWTYQNAGGSTYGRVDLEKAISLSLNTPAIQAAQAVIDAKGVDWYIDYMKKLGFDESIADLFDIGYAIGGNNFTCTPEQLMAAHATIMSSGNYIKPHVIKKIVFRSGQQDPIEPQYTPVGVMSPQAAYMAADLMYKAIHDQYAYFLKTLIKNYPTYGKTGTTDWGTAGLQYGIPDGARKDSWMVADTSQFTSVVWLGWEKAYPQEEGYSYFTHSMILDNVTGKTLSTVLDAIEESYGTPEAVKRPDGITDITHISGIFPYVAPNDSIPSQYISTGMVKTEYSKLGEFKDAIPALQNLSSFTASLTSGNTISMNWAQYPGNTAGSDDENKNKLFDISWITGPVVYKARVSQNGQTIAELTSDSASSDQSVNLAYDTDTQVCGYYGYSNTSDVSNEVCTTFRTGADPNKNNQKPENNDSENKTPENTAEPSPSPSPAGEETTQQ